MRVRGSEDMKAIHARRLTILYAVVVALAAAVLGIACAPVDDPFDILERKAAEEATPTPVGAAVPTVTGAEMAAASEAAEAAQQASLFEDAIGTIRIGDWENQVVNLENALAGYIMVYGYDYAVELVETTDEGYQDALPKGELDVVMEMAPGWYTEHAEEGLIVDVGTVKEATPEIRIGVYGSVKKNAPELVEFLGKMSPGDEIVAELASRITGGRSGINPTVAALTYLKQHEDRWTQWVPASVTEKVKAAIKGGKTSLINRKCVPGGGAGGGSPNCGT